MLAKNLCTLRIEAEIHFHKFWAPCFVSKHDFSFINLLICEWVQWTPGCLWPCPLWQKAVGSGGWWWCGWWAMTGMDEMPDGRPLTLGGWPGEGVSAGDKGRLLYTQHTGGAARGKNERRTQTLSFKKSNHRHFFLFHKVILLLEWVVALMYRSIHISPPNVPLHPNAKDYFLLIFRLCQRWLHLRSLFTTTFNLPGAPGRPILTSLSDSDNQTKLAFKLLSYDRLNFLTRTILSYVANITWANV